MWTLNFALIERLAGKSGEKLKENSKYEPTAKDDVNSIGTAHINMSSVCVKTVKITSYETIGNYLFKIHSIDGHTFIVSVFNATIELD